MRSRTRISVFNARRLVAAGLFCIATGLHAQAVPDPVLAEIGQAKLYRSEYEAELEKLPADIRAGFANSAKRVNDLIARLVVQKALAAQAKSENLSDKPEYATRFRVETDRLLAQLRVTDIENQAGREFDARRAQFEARARELYLADSKKYATPEMVSASHILFDTRKHSKEEGQQLANAAYAKAVAGADFNQLAKGQSEDPSAAGNDGRLGYFARPEMDPAFAEAAFSLKQVGDISRPVLSSFGWHVIRLDGRRPAGTRSFDEVRDVILAEQRKKYIDDKRDAVLAAIRGDPSYKFNEQAVEALVIRIDPESQRRINEEAAKPRGTEANPK